MFGIWYGKGPGVDRCSDVFKHANMAGTSKHGGVIAIAGDDHIAKSSTAAHQSDHIFKACGLPVFFPSSVQDILDIGLHAFAMSRFAGVWSAMKTIQEIVESAARVSIDPDRVDIVIPTTSGCPPAACTSAGPTRALEQEARLMDYKWYAALAYIRANRLNHNVIEGPERPLRHHRLRARPTTTRARRWSTSASTTRPAGASASACTRSTSSGRSRRRSRATSPQGLQEILVVEEKRQVIEYQLKEELYNWRADVRPHVVGKFDESEGDNAGGEWSQANPSEHWLLRAQADLTPAHHRPRDRQATRQARRRRRHRRAHGRCGSA